MTNDDGYTRITLRIPKALHEKLAGAAEDRSHSMNAEIVDRLEKSFEEDAPVLTVSAHDGIWRILLAINIEDAKNSPDLQEMVDVAFKQIVRIQKKVLREIS